MRGFFPGLGICAATIIAGSAIGAYSLGYHNAQKKAETENNALREEISILESMPVQTNIYYVVDGFADTNSIPNRNEKIQKAIEYAEKLNKRQARQ